MQTDAIQLQVLIFEIAGLSCGFAAHDVVEVLRAVTVQPLPSAPAIVSGVINRRGTIVPVLDIAARFGLSQRPLTSSDQLIVLRPASPVAVRVSRSVAICDVPLIRHVHATALPPGVAHVAGFALVPEGLTVIYDLKAFLSEDEAQTLSSALQPLPREPEEAPV